MYIKNCIERHSMQICTILQKQIKQCYMDGMILKYYEDSCIKTCKSNISWICIRNIKRI